MTGDPHVEPTNPAISADETSIADRQHKDDLLDEAIEESFPASDPSVAPRFD